MTRWSSIAPVVASVVAVFALAASATSCTSDAHRTGASAARHAGVGVVADGCGLTSRLASGVVVQRPGQVVTVAHAIAGASSVSVVDDTGTAHPATVTAFDKDRDLAVLNVPSLAAPALNTAPSAIGPGAIVSWSRDEGVSYQTVSVTRELMVTIEDIYVEDVVKRRGIEVRGDIHKGDSGSAVLSPSGDVMGIIYAQSRSRDGYGYATDSAELDALLRTVSSTPVANGRCS